MNPDQSPRRLRIRGRLLWAYIVPGSLLVCLFALPLAALVWRALSEGFAAHILAPSAFSALRISLLTSTLATLLTVVAGTPLAHALARWPFRGRAIVELIIDLPVVLPPAVAGLALLITFGRQGVFGPPLEAIGIRLPFSTAAVIIAQTFVAAPLYVRSARIGFAGVDPQLEESAHAEGANQWQMFRYVILPLTARALLSGAILTWTRALGEFGATILFAGNLEGRTQTMPLAIYLGFERNIGVAVALSALLVGVSVSLLALLRWLERSNTEP